MCVVNARTSLHVNTRPCLCNRQWHFVCVPFESNRVPIRGQRLKMQTNNNHIQRISHITHKKPNETAHARNTYTHSCTLDTRTCVRDAREMHACRNWLANTHTYGRILCVGALALAPNAPPTHAHANVHVPKTESQRERKRATN